MMILPALQVSPKIIGCLEGSPMDVWLYDSLTFLSMHIANQFVAIPDKINLSSYASLSPTAWSSIIPSHLALWMSSTLPLHCSTNGSKIAKFMVRKQDNYNIVMVVIFKFECTLRVGIFGMVCVLNVL